MSTCQSCGGVIGRDCFNPQECMEITRQQAMLAQQQPPGYDQLKVLRLVDEAWVLACECQDHHEDWFIVTNKLAVALQDICLAIKEMNEPEESP